MLKDGEKGAVLQRDKETYAIAPHFSLGLVTPDNLRKVADVAEKYKIGAIKITSAARIAMVGFKEEELDNAWEDLGIAPGHAVGSCVRSIKACPGKTLCRLGQQDALALGTKLDELYHGRPLPGKMKFGVSGCLNQCAETCIKDIGFIGKPKGWSLVVGGNGAAKPQLAQPLIDGLSDEEALEATEKIVGFYEKNANKRERIGKMINRIGIEELKKAVE
jgi:NAD(P)H-nitrite reductase large subunit